MEGSKFLTPGTIRALKFFQLKKFPSVCFVYWVSQVQWCFGVGGILSIKETTGIGRK